MADELCNKLATTGIEVPDGVLSFADKKLKLNSAEDAAEICESISNCACLRSLVLEGNTLGVDAAEAIGRCLAGHQELQQLHGMDLFTGRSKLEIPRALIHLGSGLMKAGAQLTVLDLSDNAVGPVGMDGLEQLLTSSVCFTLQQLLLNNNGWGPTGGVRLADSLITCYHNSVKAGTPLRLRVFVSGRSRFENPGAVRLAKLFKLMGSMERVVMPQNGIYHEGIEALAEALSENRGLRHLDLNDNLLTPKGAAALAASLPAMSKLELLNLDDCLLKTAGAESIARALVGNLSLQELYLSQNEIGLPGALAVVQACVNKRLLRVLQLDGNQLGERGVTTVREAAISAGLQHALQSLDEDEGEPEDSEDDDDDEDATDSDANSHTEDENHCAETDGDIQYMHSSSETKKSHSTVNKTITPKQCTLSEFLSQPTTARFIGLGEERVSLFQRELATVLEGGDKYECLMRHLRLLSLVCRVQPPSSDLSHPVCRQLEQLVDLLVRSAVQVTADDTHLLSNSLLVHLGLIKCEDKKFSINWDLRGMLRAVSRIVQQPDFPSDVKDTLQVFLIRPNTIMDKYVQEKSSLLQALYRN